MKKLLGFLLFKCPRCFKNSVFYYSIFNPTKFTKTKSHCENCKLEYEPETGFYFGAMYWSYAIIVGLIVSMSIVSYYTGFFEQAIYIIPVTIIILTPIIFRYSRLLMLYVVYPIMYKEKYVNGKVRDSG